MQPIAALDPGRAKCGLVLADSAQLLIHHALILPPAQTRLQLAGWRQDQGLSAVVLGDGTSSAAWRRDLQGQGFDVYLVDERGSTLAARDRYWQLFPARGWRALLPSGLRQPPRNWDDVVAQLLLERWLGRPLQRPPHSKRVMAKKPPAP